MEFLMDLDSIFGKMEIDIKEILMMGK